MYLGHEGIRELFKDLYEAFSDFRLEFEEFRDLGDRVVAIGRWVTCGEESGVVSTHPLAVVADFKNAKAFRVHAYLDPTEALEAAGLRE